VRLGGVPQTVAMDKVKPHNRRRSNVGNMVRSAPTFQRRVAVSLGMLCEWGKRFRGCEIGKIIVRWATGFLNRENLAQLKGGEIFRRNSLIADQILQLLFHFISRMKIKLCQTFRLPMPSSSRLVLTRLQTLLGTVRHNPFHVNCGLFGAGGKL
jgi:hypothetical protein